MIFFFLSKDFTSQHACEMIDLLCKDLVQHPQHAHEVKAYFSSLLLPIVSQLLDEDHESFGDYQKKCVAVSIMAETNLQVLR